MNWRKIICRIRGHKTTLGWATIPGVVFITPCERCQAFVEHEARVRSTSSTRLKVVR